MPAITRAGRRRHRWRDPRHGDGGVPRRGRAARPAVRADVDRRRCVRPELRDRPAPVRSGPRRPLSALARRVPGPRRPTPRRRSTSRRSRPASCTSGHDEAAAARRRRAGSPLAGDPARRCSSGAALRGLEPALAPDLVACRLAIGYPVEPAAATTAFAAVAAARGVEIVVGEPAAVAIAGDRVVGVAVAGRRRPAGAVVVAGGPWTPAPRRPRAAAGSRSADLGRRRVDRARGRPAARPGGDRHRHRARRRRRRGRRGVGAGSTSASCPPPDRARWARRSSRTSPIRTRGVAGSAGASAPGTCPASPARRCSAFGMRPAGEPDGRPLVGPAPWCDGCGSRPGTVRGGSRPGPGAPASCRPDARCAATPDPDGARRGPVRTACGNRRRPSARTPTRRRRTSAATSARAPPPTARPGSGAASAGRRRVRPRARPAPGRHAPAPAGGPRVPPRATRRGVAPRIRAVAAYPLTRPAYARDRPLETPARSYPRR